MAGRDAVAGLEDQPRLQWDVIDEGAMRAAQVLHRPDVAIRLEGAVLARQPGILGTTEFHGAGAADGDALADQGHSFRLSIGTLDQQFAWHRSERFERS